jgi:hypothetical protein
MNIEHPNYTLIAYKEDGATNVGTSHERHFSSDFQIFTQLRMDECLEKHAKLRRKEYVQCEPEFEFTVLYRGVPIAENGPIYDLYMAALEAEIEDHEERQRQAVRQAIDDSPSLPMIDRFMKTC